MKTKQGLEEAITNALQKYKHIMTLEYAKDV